MKGMSTACDYCRSEHGEDDVQKIRVIGPNYERVFYLCGPCWGTNRLGVQVDSGLRFIVDSYALGRKLEQGERKKMKRGV
jgi:hypothetical protein